MPPVPTEMFLDALDRVVKDNIDYVPPYGTGCSMYVRPLLIGTGPQIGVAPAHEYDFLMMVMPMGDYYKGGIKPVRAIIFDEYDRAAPQGMGDVKVGGNYAASLYAHEKAHHMGFPVELYLDSKTHTHVEEFATSNFLGFKKDGKVVAFRPEANAERMQRTAVRTVMPPVPTESALRGAARVRRNRRLRHGRGRDARL